ncbi:hypothetical protein AAIM60_21000 [Pseudomonas lijiangensis]|uniref:hypothetical protein n=1 Tax=Pseudomonas lijiangensis TaxID=2995658 RepID=UPI0031BAA631
MVKVKSVLALSLLGGLSACSIFTPPQEQPVIEEKLNSSFLWKAKVGTLSLTPDRRVVLVNFESGRFCAEAPTEVGSDISRAFKAVAGADVPAQVKANVGVAAAISSSNSVFNHRTQGMQLFLANSYFVCQMYMNDAISAKEMMDYQMKVFDAAANIIKSELPYMYKQAELSSKSSSAKDSVGVLKELLDMEGPALEKK